MTFNSVQYFIFLPIVVAVYWRLGRRARNALLLAASYLFYAWWDWRFLSLIAVSTVVDHGLGQRLHRSSDPRHRKLLLTTSLTVNLGLLGVFKYFNFFLAGAADVLRAVGFNPSTPALRILLPVGISFYTFQTLSYTIDIYRGRIRPTDSLLTFATFVAFFPQLVAGPIERARNLLPQFESERLTPTIDGFTTGVGLIVLGLFQKVALADAVAPVVARGFDAPESVGGFSLAVSVVAFSIQIYGDFAGYSNIARGSARLFGIELMHNFREPYLSRSITEFWRRWHISLSTWLRDYLYIPLGGNRKGSVITYRNLMITMVLGGLWHGAAWNFVIWGALHGLLLAAERLRGERRPRTSIDGLPVAAVHEDRVGLADLPRVAATFATVGFVWIFFRAASAADAWSVISRIALLRSGQQHGQDDLAIVAYALVAMVALDLALRARTTRRFRVETAPRLSGALTGLCLAAIVIFSGETQVPFIYFQF